MALYKNPEERIADARSSSYTFFLVGGLGLLVMILTFGGILPLPLHTFSLSVLSVLFVIFIFAGFRYWQNAKKLLSSMEQENARIQEIIDWYQTDSIPRAALEALEEHFTEESEEERELQRYETIFMILKGQFPDVSEALLDKLASDFCEEYNENTASE